jgi:Fe-S oxidoreductase
MGVLKIAEAIDQIDSCVECGACLDVCQTYEASGNELFSPTGRLQAARKVFQQEEITPEIVDSIYSCMNCERCNLECPVEIDISGVIWRAQVELVKKGIGPLETPNKVMEGIKKLGNTVFGDPAKRWEWLPEEFPRKESDTLFLWVVFPAI